MTDYGTLSVRGDYQGDLDEIAEVLNGFEFDQGERRDQRFQVIDDCIETDRFYRCGVTAAFPVCGWYATEDGRRLPAKKYRELPDEDDGDWHFEDYEEVSLGELSKAIAPLLKRGTLELVSISRHKNGSRHETLAIRSDGCVQRLSQEYESFQLEQTPEPDVESEEPAASLQAKYAQAAAKPV
jgi:hypothetical protein